MEIQLSKIAATNLYELEDRDPDLFGAFDRILDLLEDHPSTPLLRQHYLRPPGAYSVRVQVRGRVDRRPHYLFWIEEPGPIAFIKYIGDGDVLF